MIILLYGTKKDPVKKNHKSQKKMTFFSSKPDINKFSVRYFYKGLSMPAPNFDTREERDDFIESCTKNIDEVKMTKEDFVRGCKSDLDLFTHIWRKGVDGLKLDEFPLEEYLVNELNKMDKFKGYNIKKICLWWNIQVACLVKLKAIQSDDDNGFLLFNPTI